MEMARDVVHLRTPELEAWIEALPLADAGETYQRIMISLSKLNDSDLPAQERFAALELFRGPARYLCDALKHHFVGAALPLSHRARGVAAQLNELNMEIARGYQNICDEMLELNNFRQDFTMLATSLHRALYYLGQRLLTGYQVYEPCVAGCWRQIHLLYEAAEQKGVQASEVKDPNRRGMPETTVEDQYKQMLLLALANPYRYPQTDMSRIYALAERWASLCRFHAADYLDELQCACVVDLASDAGPCHLAYSATPFPATYRLMETSSLVRALRNSLPDGGDALAHRKPETATDRKSNHIQALLHSLVSAWSLNTKRKYSRNRPETNTTGICLGLTAVHRFIDHPESGTHTDNDDATSSSAGTRAGNDGASRGANKRNGEGPYVCEIINESADGLLLRWHNADNGKIRVGELTAISRPDESGEMRGIAVIRWLKNTDRHTLEFGIQLLSPDAIPIAIRHYHAKDQKADHEYLKGLFIPEFKAAGQPASLIIPAFLYHADDVVSLVLDHQEHCLQLAKAIDATPGFSRFLFASMAVPQGQH